ncbi:MAG: hypothetical protein AAGG11_03070 [Pseudomonadota bacterium]
MLEVLCGRMVDGSFGWQIEIRTEVLGQGIEWKNVQSTTCMRYTFLTLMSTATKPTLGSVKRLVPRAKVV